MTQLTLLIEKMQQSQLYPHPVKSPIEVIQTHASAVFLTGDYVYKLKKPVNFRFLDYSTLDKRKHFLNQELKLNKPVASDIYLEVLPLTLQDNQLILGGNQEPVEYVLKMKQFPQESLLINLFEQNKLRECHLEELGSDAVRKHLAGIELAQKGNLAIYDDEMTQKTYHRLLELGLLLVRQGYQVILDAKFDRIQWREKAISLAKSHHFPITILHCSAPMEVLSDRLSHRQDDISDATPNLLQQQLKKTDAFTAKERAYVTEIDTASDWLSQLEYLFS